MDGEWCADSIFKGDAQADLEGHAGDHRAVFVYQMDSSHYWKHFWAATILLSASSEIGDRYRIGGAIFEVA
jgi:MOSC domain-containing protein YiiM